jgi:peroxiredoxin
MARTPSTMVPLGASAPDFALPDVTTGAVVTRDQARGAHGLLVMFISRHCPFVKHLERPLAELVNAYRLRGVGAVAICANHVESHPEDAPAKLREQAAACGFAFPYLHDESQDVARAYDAACTPDFFLFDPALKLVYRGQFDASRPGDGQPVTGADLRAALEAVACGRAPDARQMPSLGCNIKWKPGREPAR